METCPLPLPAARAEVSRMLFPRSSVEVLVGPLISERVAEAERKGTVRLTQGRHPGAGTGFWVS